MYAVQILFYRHIQCNLFLTAEFLNLRSIVSKASFPLFGSMPVASETLLSIEVVATKNACLVAIAIMAFCEKAPLNFLLAVFCGTCGSPMTNVCNC